MNTLTFTIQSASAMLMHNGRLANPLDKYTKQLKEITKKRNKTDEDMQAMALVEARGGLYWSEQSGVYVPGENIEASLLAAAKFQKLGTTFKRGAIVADIECPLMYVGPEDPDDLIRDENFIFAKMVKVGTSKILRTRPKFDQWWLKFSVGYSPEQLNDSDIKRIVSDAGLMVGLGDWRPRFGLFSIKEVS